MSVKKRASVIAGLIAAVAFVLPSNVLAGDDGGKHKKGHRLLKAQLTQFNGGCPPNPVEQPGGCLDVQFTIHRAPGCTAGPNAELDGFSITMVRRNSVPAPLRGGSATLVRAGDGVATNISTTDLARNAPYTVWWVGFNPDNPCVATCSCGGDDLRPNEDAVFYATGGLSDVLGSATFIANVNYGELPTGFDQIPIFDTPDGPITFDAPIVVGAEIHNVVRAHGPRLDKKRRKKGNNDD